LILIALKNPIWWKMDFKKDHQNTFAENQNPLYAILERNFSRDSNPTICSFQNRGVFQPNRYWQLGCEGCACKFCRFKACSHSQELTPL